MAEVMPFTSLSFSGGPTKGRQNTHPIKDQDLAFCLSSVWCCQHQYSTDRWILHGIGTQRLSLCTLWEYSGVRCRSYMPASRTSRTVGCTALRCPTASILPSTITTLLWCAKLLSITCCAASPGQHRHVLITLHPHCGIESMAKSELCVLWVCRPGCISSCLWLSYSCMATCCGKDPSGCLSGQGKIESRQIIYFYRLR